MERTLPRSLLVCGVTIALVCGVRGAGAAGRDAAALKLEREAIYNDYLGTKFTDAERKLKQALAMCKSGACSNAVVAALHRDLATIYIMGIKRPDDARNEFAAALAADPNVALIRDLTTPEIERLFTEVKSGGQSAPGGAGAGMRAPAGGAVGDAPPPTGRVGGAGRSGAGLGVGVGGGDETDEAPRPRAQKRAAAADGDMVHMPPTEQMPNTPLPLYAELPASAKAARVVVKFKAYGGDWKSSEMKKRGEAWEVELSCQDVGSATGEFKYYVQAIDATGEIVAYSGTRTSPNQVTIKPQISGIRAHLPGRPAPESCGNTTDCPPDLPGCSTTMKHGTKAEGDACDESSDCQDGLACGPKSVCIPDENRKDAAKRNWVSLAVQQEFLFVPSSTDTCLGADASYNCFYGDGTYVQPVVYDGVDPNLTPLAIDATRGNSIKSGGLNRATTRVLVGYDRLIGRSVLVGLRFGYGFGGQPSSEFTKTFMPIHLEIRGSYFFGTGVLQNAGLRPYVTVAGGLSEIDAPVPIKLFQAAYAEAATVNAWHKTGTGFIAAGVGAQYAINPAFAPFAELKLIELLGTSGTAIGAQFGAALGL